VLDLGTFPAKLGQGRESQQEVQQQGQLSHLLHLVLAPLLFKAQMPM
jgi:hypothetical protein